MPVDRIQLSAARGVGNVVVLLGAKTGRDGIGGVSVLASATFDADGPARRPSVQVGDPFTEKLLIEACLEMYDAKLVQGIQDLGGAGLTCALTETAAAGRSGMLAHLDRCRCARRRWSRTRCWPASPRSGCSPSSPRGPARRPRDRRQVGRARHGDRRGRRGRPAGRAVAR
jgi:phosphoribosylformylglycinamidine (FGAM) synthase-like enzyme